jgi:peptidoglycan/xylan/chitin deacetylase (PgdA/CDA1 family)
MPIPSRVLHRSTPPLSRWTGGTYRTGNGVIAFRFDDGHDIDYEVAYPLLAARGFKAGFAICPTTINTLPATHMTWDQMRELQQAGHEILCHSWSHAASDPATFNEFMHEIEFGSNYLRELGFDIATFVQPGTWTNSGAYMIDNVSFWGTPGDLALRNQYQAYQAFIDSLFTTDYRYDMPFPNYKRYGTKYLALGNASPTLAQAKGYIDNAIKEGRGILGVFHSYNWDEATYWTTAQVTEFLNYVKAKVAQGYLNVVTPTQLMYARPLGTALPVNLTTLNQEGGDLGEWTSTTTSGGGAIACDAAAGLNSTGYGLKVDLASAAGQTAYVQRNFTASTANRIRFRFYLDPNTLTMANNDTFYICAVANSTGTNLVYVYLRYQSSGSQYSLRCALLDDASAEQATSNYNISDAPHYIEIDAIRSSGDLANDGAIDMYVDGSLRYSKNSVDNYTRWNNMGRIILGAYVGVDAGTSGTYYLDELIVNDTGAAIGA